MKAYFFELNEYDGTGISIIAENTKEARKIAVHHSNGDYNYIEICQHIKQQKSADVSGLKSGIVDDQITAVDGLHRKLYSWVLDTCPECKETTELYLQDDGSVCCDRCRERRGLN